jgi:hypothetical protein
MISIHPDLLTLVDAVEIHTSTRFAVQGRVRDIDAPGQDLAPVLQADLYRCLYTRPIARHVAPVSDAMARRELINTLSAANCGRGTWEAGWVVKAVDDEGRVAVVRDELTAWTSRDDLRVDEPEIREGLAGRVRVGKELRNRMDGFYIAVGDGVSTEGGDHKAEPIVRYYWHLTLEAAVPFMAIATELLNAAGIPFRLKVLVDPDAYRRADAGVLYVSRVVDRHLGDTIAGIHESVAPALRREVPLFTKPLARGLAIAEDPGGPLSFGEHRCRLAAASFLRSFLAGESGRDARAAALASAFEDEGLDPMRPHLGPGAEQDYILRPRRDGSGLLARSVVSPVDASPAPSRDHAPADRPPTMEAAARIGRALCQQAIWDDAGRLCNWMGRTSPLHAGPTEPTSASLGFDLYAGSAGVALFLAQLHAMTGEDEFRRTSLGALHRSVRQLDRTSSSGPTSPLSFFLGHLGLAYASWRIGALIGEDMLTIPTRALLDPLAPAASGRLPLDVIGGSAGAIAPLLSLAGSPGFEHCRDLAIALGVDLCRRAIRNGDARSWEPDHASAPGEPSTPLTGLAHGAAGIGLALFELYATTARAEFLEAARVAFAYEDALFDAQRGNWPDLRPSGSSDLSGDRPGFATAWCHGAPGIALTRLRAATLDPGRREAYLASARIAIATTLDAIDQQLEYPRTDATLCHGLAGLLEVVLIAGRSLGDPAHNDRAVSLSRALIDRHGAAGDWPSGVPSRGPNPSLMLGAAGIGYTFLRLHDPERVPSVLLLVP